jgi:hypothetical protein
VQITNAHTISNRRQIVCVSIVHARFAHASQGPSAVQDDTTCSVAAAAVPLHLGIFFRRRMTPPEKTVPPSTRTTLRIERLARGLGPSAPWSEAQKTIQNLQS